MSFFDDSHVTEVGLEGSAGPSVSIWDMVQQGFRQQYRVDSATALRSELGNRWIDNLQNLRAAGLEFDTPADPQVYTRFAEFIRNGTPVTTDEDNPLNTKYGLPQLSAEFEDMRRANEAIRQLNNPDIKTFEQILEEVSAMQQGVELETASMSERSGAGGFIGELIGAIGGSFTLRDPLNLVTAPIGAGRTIATRIATDMAVAAGVVSITEFADVQPARALAQLPERNPFFNIAAATLGAGIIRGGIEGVGVGVRRLRGQPAEDVDFDLRDSQLQQMFEDRSASPNARAGAQALDDMIFIERNNPYGDGPAAQARFLAELQQVQRVMGGEPMTAIARVLPPMPFEYIQKVADFELVREQRPFVYARMEQAQARLEDLTRQVDEAVSREVPDLIEAVRLVDREAAGQLEQLSVRVNDEALPEAARVAADIEAQAIIQRVGVERINKAVDAADAEKKFAVRNLRASRRAANKDYRAEYRKVEAEAVRIREEQARFKEGQQREAVHVFADATHGRPFNWSILQHDHVQTRVNEINELADTVDEKAAAIFARPVEGEEAVAREAWRTEDGRVDIGLKQPVDPDFRIVTDNGDMSVEAAMRDLQDDADLDDAMRTCLL